MKNACFNMAWSLPAYQGGLQMHIHPYVGCGGGVRLFGFDFN